MKFSLYLSTFYWQAVESSIFIIAIFSNLNFSEGEGHDDATILLVKIDFIIRVHIEKTFA